MSKLKEIMVQYATQRGGGLPLTPEEMCNAVVLWVDSLVSGLSIEGGYLVKVQKEGNSYTIHIDTQQLDTDIKANYFNANDLIELFEGSETVVVDVNEAGNKIEIHLDNEVVSKLARAVLTPLQTPSEPELPVLGVDNGIRWEPVSSFVGCGGTKLYLHTIGSEYQHICVVTTRQQPFTTLLELYTNCPNDYGNIPPAGFVCMFYWGGQTIFTAVAGTPYEPTALEAGPYSFEEGFIDTVTEL